MGEELAAHGNALHCPRSVSRDGTRRDRAGERAAWPVACGRCPVACGRCPVACGRLVSWRAAWGRTSVSPGSTFLVPNSRAEGPVLNHVHFTQRPLGEPRAVSASSPNGAQDGPLPIMPAGQLKEAVLCPALRWARCELRYERRHLRSACPAEMHLLRPRAQGCSDRAHPAPWAPPAPQLLKLQCYLARGPASLPLLVREKVTTANTTAVWCE